MSKLPWLHPDERRKAAELAKKSKGKYTAEQIEEQMRLMGNEVYREKPNTTAVSTGGQQMTDDGMPTFSDGISTVEVPGQANMEIQQFIITNSLDGANYIPGQSPYVASNPALNKPVVTTGATSNNLPTARCANGDLACLSGVGAQQSSVPELTQEMREAIADGANTLSRQAGVIASGATAAAAAASPQVKPIVGAVALGATVVGVGADLAEQVMRPDMNQVFRDQLLLGVPADVLTQRYPLYAPVINEIKESLP